MNIICVHHRSRKRMLIANVLSMLVIGPFAYAIALLGQFQGPAMWVAIILFVSNMGLFAWNTWTVARQNRDFVCLLTNERLVCQSPDESLARSFDVPIIEIVKLAEADQMEGGPRYSIHTQAGDSVTLTYNFGNPARSIFEELRRMLPSIPVEKS
jgi:hypothetical protein